MRLITMFSIASLLVGSAVAAPRNVDHDLFVARDHNSNARYVGRSVQFEARAGREPDCSGFVVGDNIGIGTCQSHGGTGWSHRGDCYDPMDPSNSTHRGRGTCYKNGNGNQQQNPLMVLANAAAGSKRLPVTNGRSATSSHNRY
ncbi:hypothetical protein AX17_005551 [Amanita inopinata Kibby_2008]|nr:hypothetical protein AX17_005551 [Amanita inopinata Kibby_2008]